MQNAIEISLVIPLLNEEESLRPLHQWIADVFEKDKRSYEVIYVDDGSSDDSWEYYISTCNQESKCQGDSICSELWKIPGTSRRI